MRERRRRHLRGRPEGRNPERHLRLVPRLHGPGPLLHGGRLDGDGRHLHPAAHLQARQRRGRQRGRSPAWRKNCRRSATAARPTPSSSARASNTPTARPVKASDFPFAVERDVQAQLRRLALLHRRSSAPKSSPKRSRAASPASKPTTRPAKSSSTWSNRAAPSPTSSALMFVGAAAAGHADRRPLGQPAARHRPLR